MDPLNWMEVSDLYRPVESVDLRKMAILARSRMSLRVKAENLPWKRGSGGTRMTMRRGGESPMEESRTNCWTRTSCSKFLYTNRPEILKTILAEYRRNRAWNRIFACETDCPVTLNKHSARSRLTKTLHEIPLYAGLISQDVGWGKVNCCIWYKEIFAI